MSANKLTLAVFLDRDGVLNESPVRDGKPVAPDSAAEMVIPAEVPIATKRLADAGFLLLCVTNQPDVGKGTQTMEHVQAINAKVLEVVPLKEFFICFDFKDENPDRKPNPGMLLKAAERYHIDLPRSFMVGDRWRDTEAGKRAGCTTILIDRKYTEPWKGGPPDHKVNSLMEAVELIFKISKLDRVPG